MFRHAGLILLVCAAMVLCFNGCQRSTPEGSYADTIAGFGQMMSGMALDTTSVNNSAAASSLKGMRATGMSAQGTVTGSFDPETGKVSFSGTGSGSTSFSFEFYFEDQYNVFITSETLAGMYIEAATKAKYLKWSEALTGPLGGTFSCTLTFARTAIGQKGGTVSGTASGTGPNGAAYSATLTNLEGKGDGSRMLIGGTVTAAYTSPRGNEWTLSLTYAADGTADGTITGPNYSGTISLAANGSGSYTDSDGEHALGAPVSVVQ